MSTGSRTSTAASRVRREERPMTRRTPVVSRPDPKGYFLAEDAGQGLLPWSHVVQRMTGARNYWVATTGRDGRPHCMPVWGVWQDEQFVFSTSPIASKLAIRDERP